MVEFSSPPHLADNPGAGKTIMTGLFLGELMLRGDSKRCKVVCPGMLAEQWQDELRNASPTVWQ